MADLYVVLLYLIFVATSFLVRKALIRVKTPLLFVLVPVYLLLTFLYSVLAFYLAEYITENTPVQLYFGNDAIELVLLLIICFISAVFIVASAIAARNKLGELR